jgi:hypothetical protein
MTTAYEFFRDFAGPIGTVIAPSAAAFVAYRLGKSQIAVAETQATVAERNWETANEKIVLELFERRIAIFEGIRKVVSDVLRTAKPTDVDFFEYVSAIDKAPYFFGPEVMDYLETVRILIIELQLDATVIRNHLDPDRPERIRGHVTRMTELSKFYEVSKGLFGPYIQAHQKIGGQEKA